MRSLARVVCGCVLWLALLGPAGGAELIWEVRDAYGSLRGHLFGTLHLCNADCFPLSERVLTAFSSSEVLALELDPSDVSMGAMLAHAGRLAPGEQLESMLPEVLREQLRDAVRLAGADARTLQSMKPWLASSVLMVGAAANAGFGSHWGIDLWLAREARRRGQRLIVLETVERQIEALAAGGEQAQLESLAQIVRLIRDNEVGSYLNRIRLAWQHGDAETLLDMMDEKGDEAQLEPLLDDLVVTRNREMATRIAELMRSSGPVFVAVGAAHLGGTRGLVAQLGALGFRVCRADDPELPPESASAGRCPLADS